MIDDLKKMVKKQIKKSISKGNSKNYTAKTNNSKNKTTTKSNKQTTNNQNIDNQKANSTSYNKVEKKVIKEIKKISIKTKLIMAFVCIIGVISSFFACTLICKNDVFEINGDKSQTLFIGEDYHDLGAKVIAFGKDKSQDVKIEVYKNSTLINSIDDITTDSEATYQIVYTISSIRFKNISLIRTINIVEAVEEEVVID